MLEKPLLIFQDATEDLVEVLELTHQFLDRLDWERAGKVLTAVCQILEWIQAVAAVEQEVWGVCPILTIMETP